MTWTLAIDTSHHVAVGLACDGQPKVAKIVPDTRAHVEALLPTVLEACAEAGITLRDVKNIVVGMGPGPFTGLRVGIAAAWTLAHTAGISAQRVCSLDVVAQQWSEAPGEFVVVSDARRKEVYWARYVNGQRVGEPQVSSADQVPALPIAGVVPEIAELQVADGAPIALDPAVMAAYWDRLPVAPVEPYYLRAPDATVPGKPKSALPRLKVRR